MTSASYGAIPSPPEMGDNGSTHRQYSSSWRKTNIPVLVAAFLAALATGGPTYAFGLYGSTLKAALHLTQTQLDTVSSANFCAGLLSWIPGLCVDRWGPKRSMMTGGVLSCVSLLAYWVVARQFVHVSHHYIVPALSSLGVLIFMSNALVIGSIFKVILLSCGPGGAKGTAVGVAKAYVGLGAGAYACLFKTIQRHDETDLDFLPMAAFFALITVTLPAWIFLPSHQDMIQYPPTDGMTPLHYRTVYSGLLALGLLVVGTSARYLFQPIPHDDDDEYDISTSVNNKQEQGPAYVEAILLLTAWFGPILAMLFLPPRSEESVRSGEIELENNQEPEMVKPLVSTEASSVEIVHSKTAIPVDLNLVQMLQTAPAWLLLWTCTILVGSGTMMTNNMGQLVEAHGFHAQSAGACLAMFSVAQATARVATGSVSELALTWNAATFGLGRTHYTVPRSLFLVVAAVFGMAAHSVLAVATSRSNFVLGVVLSGTAFGMVWPLMVLIVGEVFGTVNHGANYMFYDGFTSAIGTVLISKFITQEVYEHHVDPDDQASGNFECYGSGCFQLSHIITVCLCLTCLVTGLGMVYSTRTK